MSQRELIATALAALVFVSLGLWLQGCTAWQDPQGVQLPLFGDRKCSPPASQAAQQCCMDHDNCYEAGGTEADFHLCNHEFASCMLLWDVPSDIVEARFEAVERFGRSSFRWSWHRTRGHK